MNEIYKIHTCGKTIGNIMTIKYTNFKNMFTSRVRLGCQDYWEKHGYGANTQRTFFAVHKVGTQAGCYQFLFIQALYFL